MKLLFLSKRYYMNRDLAADRYGRFYEIPDYLSAIGHHVRLVCHDYRNTTELELAINPRFSILSRPLGRESLTGFLRHYRRLCRLVECYGPDVILAASDCYQIILGAALSRRYAIPFVADLYDNFSYYRASRVPGVVPLFYRALKQADFITVVSNALKSLLAGKGIPADNLYLIENAVAEKFLVDYDKQRSRHHLGFKDNRVYIGTAGELSREKGTEVLVKAFVEMAATSDTLSLVLAGERQKNLVIPEQDNILLLGPLDHDEIPVLFSALDLGVICIRENEFGRYCFPQKFYEMLACGLPLVAPAVGEMRSLLKDTPALLFRPDDSGDLKRAIREQIDNRNVLSPDIPTWRGQAEKVDGLLRNIIAK